MTGAAKPRVVIVGAGFAGLRAARELMPLPVQVMLIDRHNFHTFVPLLTKVATTAMKAESVARPIRQIFPPSDRLRFLMAEARGIDLRRRTLYIDGKSLAYDFLLLATGSRPFLERIPGAAEHAFALRSMEQAVALRNRVLSCFEEASQEKDVERRGELLTFAIVGGGAAGVEFAGALAELVQGSLTRDFPELDFREVQVVLLEASGRLLPALDPELCRYALERLRLLGIEVRLRSTVTRIEPGAVFLEDGFTFRARTVVWAAGLRGDPLAGQWRLPVNALGQVTVLPSLQVPGQPQVYVAGDLAEVPAGQPLPMVASLAAAQGAAAARNIVRQIAGEAPLPFDGRTWGTQLTIGRHRAVVQNRRGTFTGLRGWFIWLTRNVYRLIGFRHRLRTLRNWAWEYYFAERSARLILPCDQPRPRESAAEEKK